MPTTDGGREEVRAEARAAFDGDDVRRAHSALTALDVALKEISDA